MSGRPCTSAAWRTAETKAQARAACLAHVIVELQSSGEHVHLYVERRHGLDNDDRVVVRRTRQAEPPLSFEHASPDEDPLLWLPDCFAWPVGASGDWRRRVEPLLAGVMELP